MAIKKALPMSGNFPIPLDDEEGPEYWQSHIDSWLPKLLMEYNDKRNDQLPTCHHLL